MPARRRGAHAHTPIRRALKLASSLRPSVKDGLRAIKPQHIRDHIAEDIRQDFSDSLDLDEAVREGNERANRWDYLVGVRASGKVLAIEPHTANTGEIAVVIAKKRSAQDQLRSHLVDGARVEKWIWVASGRIDIIDIDKAKRRLDEKGITLVGRLQRAHLP